jgi:hypothetical protein
MKWCNNILAILTIILLASPSAIAQGDTLRVPVDTIYFSGYTAISYRVYEEDNYFQVEWEIFLGTKKLMTSFKWYPGPGFYDYSYNPDGGSIPSYLRDINGDGKGEIILSAWSGGNDGRGSSYIYSLDTTASLIGVFDGLNTSLSEAVLCSYDSDNIYEIGCNDRTYECWPYGCAGSPAPSLIWKWDGSKYRLANYKLGVEIMKQDYHWDSSYLAITLASIQRDTVKIRNFNPNIEDQWPIDLINLMLNLAYIGQAPLAEQFCEYAWASQDTTRPIFEKLFWEKVHSSYYWQELQNSNW